jgi:hypothetical protein
MCRASFPTLVTPKAMEKGGKEKYSIVLVFADDTERDWAEEAIDAAGVAKWGEKKYEELRKSAKFRYPVKEADDDEKARYPEGSWYMNCYSEEKPGVVFRTADPDTGKPKRMTDADVLAEIYPGVNIRAAVKFYGYEHSTGKGVAVAVNNVQKMGENERLDSRVKAEDEFEATEPDAADLAAPDAEEAPAPSRPPRRTRKVEDLLA